jgi:4-aminobutyrate aminotransferase-like enzyme
MIGIRRILSRRTNEVQTRSWRTGIIFACQQKFVVSNIMVLSKALTGIYLSLEITLYTEQMFSPFFQSLPKQKGLFYYKRSQAKNANRQRDRLDDAVCITPFQLCQAVQAIGSLIAKVLWQRGDSLE